MMNIRIIIPICNNSYNGYCNDAFRFNARMQILTHALSSNMDLDLVITSHNFFDLSRFNRNINQFSYLISFLNNRITTKVPLIIGFDLNRGSSQNPYGGIDAVVCFLNVSQNQYVCHTYIWECWRSKNRCRVITCFNAQNNRRYFNLYGFDFGLLSCGDMYTYCNKRRRRSYLRNVDIYVDLSHLSLPLGQTIHSIRQNLINYARYVIVTQQIKPQEYSMYFNNNLYKLVFSSNGNIYQNQRTLPFPSQSANPVAYFVDITI